MPAFSNIEIALHDAGVNGMGDNTSVPVTTRELTGEQDLGQLGLSLRMNGGIPALEAQVLPADAFHHTVSTGTHVDDARASGSPQVPE